MFHLECWGVFLYPCLKILGLTDLIFDVTLMIIVVGKGVIHLSRREMGKLAQHFFDSEAQFMVAHDGTHRKTGAANDGATTTHALFAFDVRVVCFCRFYVTHTKSPPQTLPRGFPPRKPGQGKPEGRAVDITSPFRSAGRKESTDFEPAPSVAPRISEVC